MKTLYWLDTETTSINGEIVEIAIIKTDENFNIISYENERVKPSEPIHPAASGVHHITNEDVADKPPIADLKYKFDMVDEGYIIAHNLQFDLGMIDKADILHTNQKQFCTLKLLRELDKNKPFLDHKLQTYYYALECYKDQEFQGDAHSALYDVHCMISVVKKMLEKHNLTIDQAYDLIQPKPAYKKPCYLKKYRGQGITWEELLEIDYSYMEWVANNFTWKEDDPEQVELRDWFGEKFGG